MNNNKMYSNYLETAPIGNKLKIDYEKIKWIKHNFVKFFKGKNASYLDIGPGKGEVLRIWKELKYKNISSIDISKDVVEYLRKNKLPSLLVNDSIQYLKKHKNYYDFIMLNDVLEHIDRKKLVDFFNAVYNALKVNGRVVIKTPNAQSPFFNTGFYADLTHATPFTESSYTQLFKLCGVKKYSFYSENNPVSFLEFKNFLALKIITPIFFSFIRIIRSATYHNSPKILTQAIIVVVDK